MNVLPSSANVPKTGKYSSGLSHDRISQAAFDGEGSCGRVKENEVEDLHCDFSWYFSIENRFLKVKDQK